MARFNAAVMDDAADAKFQNRYNYLLDLLDMGYIVEKRINGVPIKIETSPAVGLAFYQGGGPTGWVYRGGLELINSNLFLTANAIKGVELADRYMLWEDPPSTVGDPFLQLYDNDVRVGYLNFSDLSVSLASIPTGASNDSYISISADQYTANAEDYVSLALYGNKQANNYAKISVYSDVLSGGGDYAQYTFSPTGLIAKLNGTDRTVWHSGNDGSGSGLDADMVDGYHASSIVESGSNANGFYVKYLDGTMICSQIWGLSLTDTGNNVVQGLTWYYNSRAWTFPVAFYATPMVSMSSYQNLAGLGMMYSVWRDVNGATLSTVSLYSFNAYALMSTSGIAIGRWKA